MTNVKQQDLLDKAQAVRKGEELPVGSVNEWLSSQIQGISGEPLVTQYSGGASNWTYCLTYPEKSLILRRAPRGTKAKGAHDMNREFTLQQALKPVYSYVPEMLGFCDDRQVLDSDFYVMEKVNGIIPRKNLPSGLSLSPSDTRQLCQNVLDCLIELHQVDIEQANLTHIGKGQGYIQRQIDGWSERYSRAKTWNVPSGQKIMQWLQANIPTNERICLTHNDFRFDNVILAENEPTKVIGVLDWELATLGDPLMDLGNSLAYWVEQGDDFMAQSSRRQPTHLKGMFTRKEVIDYYCKKMSIDVEQFTFYEVYGLFRLAGIVQQIYYRYHHKQTNNPAFKQFWLFSHYLLWRCSKAIKQQRKG
ncbi:phosphotransferase family protein [Thalassotalea sp. M1531]|uniref:Phosphotransferase family protein n=1 Tax=Thalassotalea algicola TaxID=2716224 RepID=A0A7Y0Q5P4_9GAMM|nr:phosphotransferase family protein [Thalassotalea algicola]NMP30336.1 phosphotransferase family protein [Thalassotalea algicola]